MSEGVAGVDVSRLRVTSRQLTELAALPVVAGRQATVAATIAADAARLAPVRTGTLRRNITVERERVGGVWHYLVGWAPAAYYGRYVELGTRRMNPRPHLVPAAVKHGATAARR